MAPFKINPVYPMMDGTTVILPPKQIRHIVDGVNEVISAVNTHTVDLAAFAERVAELEAAVKNIATILEEIYNAS